MTAFQQSSTTQRESGQEHRAATFKITQLIWLLLGLLEGLLGLRFIFKLIAVNAANPFAVLLYKVTDFFVAPFASLAKPPAAGGMVLEISTLLAMIVYFLIGWALERIVYVLFYRPRGSMSVRQTTVTENVPQQPAISASQTTVTERTNSTTTDPHLP